jgi:hypothetical protein
MNKTALFLILLIAPLALGQDEMLNMFDRTPEGKEVLDHLFIQTNLMGGNLDLNFLRQVLKTNRDRIEGERKRTEAVVADIKKTCHDEKVHIGQLVHEHTEKEMALKRALHSATSHHDRKQVFLKRAEEELDNYKKFQTFVTDSKKSWAAFYDTLTKNHKNISSLLHNAMNTLKNHHKSHSFVELPESYTSSLAQIRVDAEGMDMELTGMEPIISNLLEIMNDKDAVKQQSVRHALHELIESLIEKMRDAIEDFDEENQHQSALFEHLVKSFEENVKRSTKTVEQLKKGVTALENKAKNVSGAASHAAALSDKVKHIFELRLHQCNSAVQAHNHNRIRTEKVNAIISQIEEILLTKSNGLKSFFIQREMRRN